jgi:hypothetical protein
MKVLPTETMNKVMMQITSPRTMQRSHKWNIVTDSHAPDSRVFYSDVLQSSGTVQKLGFHFMFILSSLPEEPDMSQI